MERFQFQTSYAPANITPGPRTAIGGRKNKKGLQDEDLITVLI